MAFHAPVPILRIFDEAKAREFYLGFLGFTVDFEHRFEPGTPIYLGISRGPKESPSTVTGTSGLPMACRTACRCSTKKVSCS